MLHATTVKGNFNVAYKVKTCLASKCGHEVTYTTKRPKWCDACNPMSVSKYYHRLWARRHAQPKVDRAIVKPGFCSVCNSIRLSKEDVDGVCLFCKGDK